MEERPKQKNWLLRIVLATILTIIVWCVSTIAQAFGFPPLAFSPFEEIGATPFIWAIVLFPEEIAHLFKTKILKW